MRFAIAALLALGCLAGCDSKKDEGPPPPPPEAATKKIYTDSDLKDVCSGKGVEGAAKYEKKKGKASPVTVFVSDLNGDFTWKSMTSWDAWEARDPEDYQLVACVKRTKTNKVRECAFDEKKPAHYLDMHDTSYTVTIREAATGKEVAKKDVEVKAQADCPTMHMFREEHETEYASPRQSIVSLAAPTMGEGAPMPGVNTWDYDLVCQGQAIPQAAAHDEAGTSPLLVFVNKDGVYHDEHYGIPYEAPYKVDEAKDVQLIACVDPKNQKKVESCEMKNGAVVEVYDTDLEVRIVAAKTGKVLETKTFSAKGGQCPFMKFMKGKRAIEYAPPPNEYKKFLEGFAKP